MMTRQQRAKQFAPFDAMKGLQEALRAREELHSRVEKHEISEEDALKLSMVLSRLRKGSTVKVSYYCAFHDVIKEGRITEFSSVFKYLKLDGEKIPFENLYKIKVIEFD